MVDQQQPQEMNVVGVDVGHHLPLGFRFQPSDFEIVNHYLTNKIRDTNFTCRPIREVDLNKTEPWDLPDQANWCEKEGYFFYQKDRKYPTGTRANRATEAGYWKSTGKDKGVFDTTGPVVLLVGMKKTLVFYKGRAPRGDKTNWVMHEYRLEGSGKIPSPTSASSSTVNAAADMKASIYKDEWVVCRVFKKTNDIKKTLALAYQVAMAGLEIERNQNIIPANPIPMPPQLPLPMPMPMPQFPIIIDFTNPLAPYYPDIGAGMPPMMPPMAGIGGAGGLQINGAMFGNPMVEPAQLNFYHQMVVAGQMGMVPAIGQMEMGAAVGQMGIGPGVVHIDMGAIGVGDFNVAAAESRPPSSTVSQEDDQDNAADISSTMSVSGPRAVTTTIEMDGVWKYNY